MKQTSETSFMETIIVGLQRAVVELEEFRVQAALGKAEARDLYEESRKKFLRTLRETSEAISKSQLLNEDKYIQMQVWMDELKVQLALGKAETREMLEKQRKKIATALSDMEKFIRENPELNHLFTRLLLESGKLKIKLEILQLRYEMKKLEARIAYGDSLRNLMKALSGISEQVLRRESRVEHFSDEIKKAMTHFRKAFVRK